MGVIIVETKSNSMKVVMKKSAVVAVNIPNPRAMSKMIKLSSALGIKPTEIVVASAKPKPAFFEMPSATKNLMTMAAATSTKAGIRMPLILVRLTISPM